MENSWVNKKIFVATTIEGQILLGMICHFENSHETRCKTTVQRGLLEAIKMTNTFRKKHKAVTEFEIFKMLRI